MKFTVDRIEGDFAVVITEDKRKFDMPLELLSPCKEGDVFSISKDEEETKLRGERIEKLAHELWSK